MEQCGKAEQQGTTGDRKMDLRGQWTQETVTQPLSASLPHSTPTLFCTNLHATTAAAQTESFQHSYLHSCHPDVETIKLCRPLIRFCFLFFL